MKRTQKLVTWSIVILVVLVVLLMLMSNLRRSSRVVLPDTSTSAGDSAEQTSGGSAIQVVEVTPETVQAAIATLHRPEAYSRSVTVEYLWNGGSSTSEITVSASGGWSRTDRTLPDGQQTIPTYEDVLALAPEQIAQADYRMVSDVRCIYVETAEDDWGYVQRYWVSVDTGLLAVAERLQDGETVYRMAALTVDETAPDAKTFTLPDGTALI